MIGLLKKLLPPLSAFDPPFNRKKAGRGATGQSKVPPNAKPVDGKLWVENIEIQTANSRTWDKIAPDGMGVRVKELLPEDEAWLDLEFQDTKKGWNAELAIVLKAYWATQDDERPGSYYSAARVEEKNRTSAGLKDGFSERNVKKYFKAFNDSQRERYEAELERQG